MARNTSKRSQLKRKAPIEDLFAKHDKARKTGQPQKALALAQQINEQFPQAPLGWELSADAYAKLNRAGDATIAMQRALLLSNNPTAELRFKLVQFQVLAGQAQSALAEMQALVESEPENLQFQVWLSRILHSLGNNKEALVANDKAMAINADDEEVLLWRSRILNQLKRPDETLEVLHRLAKIAPNRVGVHNHIADIAVREGDYDTAERHFKEELKRTPNHPAVHSNLVLAGHYNPAYSAETLLKLSKDWDARFALPLAQPRPETSRIPHRKIRVGLLSGGFRMHPVGQMILPALEHLSASNFSLYFYTANQFVDGITLKIKEAAHCWKVVEGLNDEELNQEIRNDQIDILIDMSGAGEGSRQLALARQPAPLLVKWVGMLISSTGMGCMDYLLSDGIETPVEADRLYTEKLIRLPDDYICYHLPSHLPKLNSLPALTNDFITFGCLNNPAKLSPPLLKEWAQLMHEVPNSKLLLRGIQFERAEFRARITASFEQYGISTDRILLEGAAPHNEFMATYHRIDIALDSWPYSGGLTTCEALAMGVPVVTCVGPTFAGRHSATHLANAGLPELVTDSWDDFRKRVKELANDLPSLAVIRAALRTILTESPVCDGERFAKHLTTALRGIWQRHCEGKPPEALTFNKAGEAWFADQEQAIELVEVEAEPESQEAAFKWNLESPITVIDNGALFARHENFADWMQTGNFAVITFDPGSLLTKQAEELKQLGEWHHYAHATLGDGSDITLYATLSPEHTGTLKPLAKHHYEKQAEQLRVLSELPISTVPLNAIDGLPGIDMLVLDDLNDAITILENGGEYLKETLIIQVKVAFQPTHERQPNLAELQHWASRNGFRFYTLTSIEYREFNGASQDALDVSELFNASAVLLPTTERIKFLRASKAISLAYLLDTLYQFNDAVHGVLELSNNLDELNSYAKKKSSNQKLGIGKEKFCYIEKVDDLAEAEKLVKEVKGFQRYNEYEIKEVIKACEKKLKKDENDNVAFFILTHALLLRNYEIDKEDMLGAALKYIGWENKFSLYSYWFDSCYVVKEIDSPICSVIVIANKYKDEIVENVRELRSQGGSSLEIIFVNNGAKAEEFLGVNDYINKWVNITGNSGAYLARNLGFVFSSSPVILFVDDDGLPEEKFVSSHIEAHAKNKLACLRGACRTYSGNDPAHYNLGNKEKINPPTLEGNVSFSRASFSKVGGWGDYILFGHGGFDISIRLFEVGYKAEHQQYSPKAVLKHEYTQGSMHASEKFKKQKISGFLLEAFHGGASKKIKQYFSAGSVVLSKNPEPKNSHAKPIVPENSFPPEVEELVVNAYSNANTILEYGTGGSTIIAAGMTGKTVYGVENDREWAANMRRVIESGDFANTPLIHHVDIGETGKWAKPLNNDKWKCYPDYAKSIWGHESFQDPDVVLIDGRLRTSCLLMVLKKAKKKTLVLFDDYKERTYYHVVERLIKPERIVGRMAVFYVDPSKEYIKKEDVEWVEAEFYKVTMAGKDYR